MATPRIFINYRSTDTGETASALYRELKQRLKSQAVVFIDHARIEGGNEWPARLRAEVDQASAMLCLIGHHWLPAPESGQRRLDLPGDWVRCEIEQALKRCLLVIPVLVEEAPLPEKSQLPETLAILPDLQARPLRRRAWESEIDQILADLGLEHLPPAEEPVLAPAPTFSLAPFNFQADVRSYLKDLIADMERRNVDPYVDQPAEDRGRSGSRPEYARELGHILALPRLSATIAEVVGASGRSESLGAPSDAIGLRTRTVRSILEVLWRRRHPVVLLGEPGSGKSTTLRKLVVQLAQWARFAPSAPIPIYVELGRFRHPLGENPARTILTFIREFVPPGVPHLRTQLASGFMANRLVIVFDGMDEIPRVGDYAERTAALAKFATDYQPIARSVFACRTNDFDPAFGHQQFVLQPFDERRIRKFLRTLGPRFQIEGEPYTPLTAGRRLMQLDELGADAGNPLTLSLAVHFMRKYRKWPRGRVVLFQDHLATLADKALRRRHQSEPADDAIRATVDAWSGLAYEIFRRHGSVFTERATLEAQAGADVVKLALDGGLLIEDVTTGLVKFHHHRLQEFLVARRLHLPNPPQPDWSAVLVSPRWQETLLNYFAIGGRDRAALEVVLSSLRPGAEYFRRLKPIVERAEKIFVAAFETYRAAKAAAAAASPATPEQVTTQNLAGKRLLHLVRRGKRIATLSTAREVNWSDHVLFAARVAALLPTPASPEASASIGTEADITLSAAAAELRDGLTVALEGLLKFGRPPIQVRMLTAWRECAHWCSAAVLTPTRASKSEWVRSQTIFALASTPLEPGRVDYTFTEDLERELLNLRLPAHLATFWKAAPLQPGRRLQVVAAVSTHFTLGLMILAVAALTGLYLAALVLPWMGQMHPSLALLGTAWLALVGLITLSTSPESFLLRLAQINAWAGAVAIIGARVLALVDRSDADPFMTRWAIWLDLVLTTVVAVSIPLMTTSLLLLVMGAFRGFLRLTGGERRKQALRSFKAPDSALTMGSSSLWFGVIAVAVSAFITLEQFRTVALTSFGGLALLFSLFGAVKDAIKAWKDYSFKELCRLTLGWLVKLPLFLGSLALIGALFAVGLGAILVGGGWAIEQIPSQVGEGFRQNWIWIVVAIATLFLAGHLASTLKQMYWECLFWLSLANQQRSYRGTLAQWSEEFSQTAVIKNQKTADLVRRRLLSAFDHRSMGISAQAALDAFYLLEERVEAGTPAYDLFHQTMYGLHEANRQQRWVDPGQTP